MSKAPTLGHPLPEAYCQAMIELLGKEEASLLFDSLESDAPTSVRLSKHKGEKLLDRIQGLSPVPWCSLGYYLESRPSFTGDPAFHAGLYYVQEASSMLLAQIAPFLGEAPLSALDLCAAPGGKSTLLLDMLPEGSTLLANEYVRNRAYILEENLHKWGNPRSIVTNSSAEQLGELREQFDLILVDAPCSGEGMFRKDPQARSEWTSESPRLCAERQREILQSIWPALSPGGLMVYSTCTMNLEENEQILDYITDELGATSISLGDDLGNGIWQSPFSSKACYRMMPHRCAGEGLFMAVVRKEAEEYPSRSHKPNKASKSDKKKKLTIPQEAYGYILEPQAYEWDIVGEELIQAYPQELLPLLHRLQKERISILSAGIPVAYLKGKSLIPHTALALSAALNREAFDSVDLEPEQVIPYLSREQLQLSSSLSSGIKLLCFEGTPLGFAKHLGNRTNNLYPAEWRIKHSGKLMPPTSLSAWLHQD